MTENIVFKDSGYSGSGKTLVNEVYSLNGIFLGTIKWHGAWRKYCFFPAKETLFDSSCLQLISQTLDNMTRVQREKIK